MSKWLPAIGEHAHVLTTINGQWMGAKRVKVTAVLKTKIKTSGGDFSRRFYCPDAFEEYPARDATSLTQRLLARAGSDLAAGAVRAVTIALNVQSVRVIGKELAALPLNGEGTEAAVADAIERLRGVRLDAGNRS